jgi:hypothetical protein
VVIDGVMPCTNSHLPGTHAERVDVCPPSFRILAVRSCRPFQEVEGESRLTFLAMTIYVELRNYPDNTSQEGLRHLHPCGKLR